MHNNQYKLCLYAGLKEKKRRKKKPLLIHSNFELYILHTYVCLCETVHLLEFEKKKKTQKERTDEEDL